VTLTYPDLSPQQRAVLDELPFDGNHLVSGPPGSGKSLLAVQRAAMLALTGTPVALLTRSNLLRQLLAGHVQALGAVGGGVRVMTVHAWLAEWYGGWAPTTGSDGAYAYDWAAFYDRAVDRDPDPGLTLVVDEGQDLPPEFYRLCRLIQARVTVFADECQRLTETNSTLAEIEHRLGRCTRHELDGNHRNTRQIAAFAAHFHTGGGTPPLPDREGPPPRLHRLPRTTAPDLLIHLAEQHPDRSIGVIVNSRHAQFSLLGSLERRAPRLSVQLYTSLARKGRFRTLDLSRPGIVLVHRASAKGLGFDTVVVPDTHVDAATDPTSAALRMTYYVMATRARRELHLAYEGEAEPPLLAHVRPGELWRD
jgi:hypothetical protein